MTEWGLQSVLHTFISATFALHTLSLLQSRSLPRETSLYKLLQCESFSQAAVLHKLLWCGSFAGSQSFRNSLAFPWWSHTIPCAFLAPLWGSPWAADLAQECVLEMVLMNRQFWYVDPALAFYRHFKILSFH